MTQVIVTVELILPATEHDRSMLTMFLPLKANCIIEDGKLIVTYGSYPSTEPLSNCLIDIKCAFREQLIKSFTYKREEV